jgi:hypothetical protein
MQFCNFDWTKYTIKHQLMYKYGCIVGFGMLSIFLCIITFILVLTNILENKAEFAISQQTISNFKSLSSDNANMIESLFTKTTRAVLFPYLYSTQISHEPEFNLNDIPGYFDDGTTTYLATPLEYDMQYNKQVSYIHSS